MSMIPSEKISGQKLLRVLCLSVLLATGFVFSVHHHDLDGRSHDECPVCFACHNCSSAIVEPLAGIDAALPPEILPRLARDGQSQRPLLQAGTESRAPPTLLT